MSATECCTLCAQPFDWETAPQVAKLQERWRSMLKPICPECSERQDAELAEEEAKRERQEREHQQRAAALATNARRRASGIPAMLAGRSWQDVADTRPDVLAAAQAWAHNLGPAGLLLIGPVGVGKTWLAAAAASARLEHAPVRWFSAPVVLSRLALPFGNPKREEALDALLGTNGALILDDIDKARPTEYAAEQLFCAVDVRVTKGVPLLVTTNLELSALAARYPPPYGEALASRLGAHCEQFALDGPDRRDAPLTLPQRAALGIATVAGENGEP
jgi:DNA replication protein DnaC